MNRLFFILFSFSISFPLLAQSSLDWNTLADVTFEERKNDSLDLLYNQATFGPLISPFKEQEVAITGYMIPMDALGISYALSKNPNAVCFFCGGAGPETVVQLRLAKIKRYQTDQRLTFKGILKMNEKDIDSLTYVLLEAEEL